jgi:hypothetical protein
MMQGVQMKCVTCDLNAKRCLHASTHWHAMMADQQCIQQWWHAMPCPEFVLPGLGGVSDAACLLQSVVSGAFLPGCLQLHAHLQISQVESLAVARFPCEQHLQDRNQTTNLYRRPICHDLKR